jgi:hypothetical protein
MSASGSSRSRRSVQSTRAESLPPLHERAKDTCGGCSAGSVLTLCVRDRRCRNWIVCPLMKNLRVCEGREARRRLPHEPPFLRGLAFVRHRAVDLAHPRWAGHRSCGTAPDSHRTSPSLHRPGICARPPEHTPPSGLRLSVEVGPGGTPLLVRHIKRINESSGWRRQAPSVSSSGGSATRSSVTLATPAPPAPRAGE